jgi:uncharacterized protein (TIGR02145 family)
MKKNNIIIFSFLLLLTVGIIIFNYSNQLVALFVEGAAPNPGHLLTEIEGGVDLATKAYVDNAIAGVNFDSGLIPNSPEQTRPACSTSTKGMIWYDYANNFFLGCNGASWGYLSVPPWTCGDEFVDSRDGNVYPTVQIGTQCWMAKNLNYNIGLNWCYNGDVSLCHVYGRLYPWSTAQTACPPGWKLPTDAEQYILESYLATGTCDANRSDLQDCSPAGNSLKFNGPSGFQTLLSGLYSSSFVNLGLVEYMWSSSVDAQNSLNAWSRSVSYHSSQSGVWRSSYAKTAGLSVRCLKN